MSGAPLIELRGIRKCYGGGDQPQVEVLRGIDLDIQAGEFVAIVGASGSGKSTLMHLLGCLDRPSAGSYRCAGRDVASLDADELARLRRETFGFVFQGYHLIPSETARENVEIPALYAGLPAPERRQRATALLERLGLGEQLERRPGQLSGGQQQRVSIARALINGGRIILADEPTGALDSRTGTEVMRLLNELADSGHTVVLITHDRDVAAQARRVIEISDGAVVRDSGARPDSRAPEPAPVRSGPARPADEWREACRGAWRGMRLNRLRTALTLLGIVIGVASVIVMLAVGLGVKQKVIAQMAAMGSTILYVSGSQPPGGGPRGEITPRDVAAIAKLAPVRRVMPVIGDPLTVRQGNVNKELYVFASSAQMPDIHHWPVARGRFFSALEDAELTPVAVLGHKAARDFFGAADPLGRQLLIGSAPFRVVGVMREKGADSGAQDYDDMVFIPYQSGLARVYHGFTRPDYTVVEALSSAHALAAEKAIAALLRQRHGREDFGIGNAAAQLQAEARASDTLTLMLGLIAAVSLVVGGIGVMNVMLMTVRERTREIGIRMATGARQRDIHRQFLTEAVLVTVVGGAAGVALGLIVGAALLAWGVPLVFSLSAMFGAFACALVTGLVFGIMPARTAARLDPVAALAAE